MPEKNANLYSAFEHQVTARADKTLLINDTDTEWRYADVAEKSSRLANTLTALGVRVGDRVSVQVHKSPESLWLYLACLKAGFAYHPLNMAYTSSELEYFLGNAEPALVVCDPANEASIRRIAGSAGKPRVLTLGGDGEGTLTDLAANASDQFETVQSENGDLAALLYSSGTTGVPKGIMLTHANLLSNTEALVAAWGFSENDRLLHALPIFHVHGLFVAIGCVMLSGASMRWLPGFDVKKVVRFLPECTVMMGVPTYYTRLLAEASFTKETAANVRVFISGSAPLLEETFHEFEKRAGHRILERYGMTETNMNTSNPLDGERKPGTVGPPLPGVAVRICDDDGRVLPPGEIGNLQVRGPNVFVGYWRMPEKTAEDFTEDGYFNTGDKGVIDDEGYVSIVGRAKDVVITGGLNVYPKEVELFIDDLPGVKESAVIGVPHPDFGEAVVAVVVPTADSGPTEESIIASCRESLANFKVPKRVLFVDALPRNTMAKVQKARLRDEHGGIFNPAT